MPYADRNQFAVEIVLSTGTNLQRTVAVADSLEHILRQDPRVASVASFKGCASPRFQNSYAPQLAGSNFAQFIVNTAGNQETSDLIDEYSPQYSDYFPEARIRFKQLSYSEATYPIELRLSGEDKSVLKRDAERLRELLQTVPGLTLIHTDLHEPQVASEVELREDEAMRLGIDNLTVEATLAKRYGKGVTLANAWEGDYNIPIIMKNEKADSAALSDLEDELIPVVGGVTYVPLRQIAVVTPVWKDGQIVRRNGMYAVTVQSELQRGENGMAVTALIQDKLKDFDFSPGVALTYGGDQEDSDYKMPMVMAGLVIAAIIIFFILVIHFHKVNIAALIFVSMTLCFLGAAIGIIVLNIDFSITCVLGLVSLMGIIVRNGIIMIDYAEELRTTERLDATEAIYHSAHRRMRPIFLTSAAASMGVIPMILGGSGLWMPMGTVICFGTLITMISLLTVLPAAYLLIFRNTSKAKGECRES